MAENKEAIGEVTDSIGSFSTNSSFAHLSTISKTSSVYQYQYMFLDRWSTGISIQPNRGLKVDSRCEDINF